MRKDVDMLKRKALEEFRAWKARGLRQALLVTGARQVGKTFLIREFARSEYAHVVEFDLVDQRDVCEAMGRARSSSELFLTMAAFAGEEMVPGETVIFIDEVQECSEVLTLVKYLVQREGFDYIISGSLLGVELEGVRSLPVGYVHIVEMYPLDFEEFCWANGVGTDVWDEARDAFEHLRPVFELVHDRLQTLFRWYLAVGGMPRAVVEFTDSQNLALVQGHLSDILELYRHDVSKYAPAGDRLAIREIFDQMPSQLDSQSKRFNFSSVAPKGTFERYQAGFLWLVDAGVALAVRNVTEPRHPLLLAEQRSFFKLFMNDVGLLCAACGMRAARSAALEDGCTNYGSIYENAVAQELHAQGLGTRFFRNRRQGELDFVIEVDGCVLPIEVKSGKDYHRHSALTNVLAVDNYGIDRAVVLCEGNVEKTGKVEYLPVYMVAFLGLPRR